MGQVIIASVKAPVRQQFCHPTCWSGASSRCQRGLLRIFWCNFHGLQGFDSFWKTVVETQRKLHFVVLKETVLDVWFHGGVSLELVFDIFLGGSSEEQFYFEGSAAFQQSGVTCSVILIWRMSAIFPMSAFWPHVFSQPCMKLLCSFWCYSMFSLKGPFLRYVMPIQHLRVVSEAFINIINSDSIQIGKSFVLLCSQFSITTR